MSNLSCFKAYDIRGKLGTELNDDIAYNIACATAKKFKPKKVAIGSDIRLSSEPLKQALTRGFIDSSVDVIDLGLTGTEEVYFAAQHLDIDVAIEVTASHNPVDYNGMKLVLRDAVPISGDTGLHDIKALAEQADFETTEDLGAFTQQSILTPYINHLLSYIENEEIRPLHIVTNAGNGAAGHVIDALEAAFSEKDIPIRFTKIQHQPDGTFPNGIPNPLLPENRASTKNAVLAFEADFGIAWDGDFDRCFLFDEKGNFIEGYYIVGLLAQMFLHSHPGEKIIHDPRLTWNTQDIVKNAGGLPIQSKTGHAFIKERMRAENAIYGGEMSAHHYFRDFAYCDSGMIPWLLISALMSKAEKTLSQLVKDRVELFPSSGEINRTIKDPGVAIDNIYTLYAKNAKKTDKTDGISVDFENWRFNLRRSNTEPVVRLNVESKNDSSLMQSKTKELLEILDTY